MIPMTQAPNLGVFLDSSHFLIPYPCQDLCWLYFQSLITMSSARTLVGGTVISCPGDYKDLLACLTAFALPSLHLFLADKEIL